MVVVRDVWRVLQPNGGGMQYAVAVHLFTVRHHMCVVMILGVVVVRDWAV